MNTQIVVTGTPYVGQNLYLKLAADNSYRTVNLSTGFTHNSGPSGLIWAVKPNKSGFYKFTSDGSTFWENDGREVRGMIQTWAGTTGSIPDEWAFCDGANGTPNLTGRFILAASGNNYGELGGSKTHTHAISITSNGPNSTLDELINAGGGSQAGDGPHTHDVNGNTAASNTFPLYYTLAYIMKL